jgi:hypothetical protein
MSHGAGLADQFPRVLRCGAGCAGGDAAQRLVELSDEGFKVTGLGWFFVRGVAMLFDRYLQADRNRARFSRII